MAIAYVNGTTSITQPVSGSYNVAFSSIAGNSLFTSICFNGGRVQQIVDSNGKSWSILGTLNGCLAYIINSAAVTSITVTTTAVDGMATVIGEYSGISTPVGGFVQSTGTTSPVTISETLLTSADWFIAGLNILDEVTPVPVAASGNLRNYVTYEFNSSDWVTAILMDNTGASPTNSATYNVSLPEYSASAQEFSAAAIPPPPPPLSGNLADITQFGFGVR